MLNNSRYVHIYCDGGFGNRFNCLISGMILAEELDLPFKISWPKNNWCQLSFKEIFQNNLVVDEHELLHFQSSNDYVFLTHENQLNRSDGWPGQILKTTLRDWETYINQSPNKSIFFFTSLIPQALEESKVLLHTRKMEFLKPYLDISSNFMSSINSNFRYPIGIHIRKTDFGDSSVNEKIFLFFVKKFKWSRFFICSDDPMVESLFLNFQNCLIYKKTFFVSKLVDGEWNSKVSDSLGNSFPFNVNRSEECVRESIIDLLCLARCRLIKTSSSTFLTTAQRIRASGLVSQNIKPSLLNINDFSSFFLVILINFSLFFNRKFKKFTRFH